MKQFFVIAPLGLEEDLMRELREIEGFLLGANGRSSPQGFASVEVIKGGVLIEAEPLLALQLHSFSKLASRILMRIAKFRATEFSILEKELRKVDPKTWIGDAKFSLKVSATRSKLGHEKRILETASRAWRALKPEDENPQQRFYLRSDQDQFELSLDLTGAHLHERGIARDLGGLAPIRETLAAALVRYLRQDEPASSLSQIHLMDPMAGSGTLISEAAHLDVPLFSRTFAFQSQPWIPKILQSASFAQNYRLPAKSSAWAGFYAWDENPEARERLQELARRQNLALELKRGNEFKGAGRVWVIANPPYGERLKAIPTPELLGLLLAPKPERVAVILPENLARDLMRTWSKDWTLSQQRVSNGGLPCLFVRAEKT